MHYLCYTVQSGDTLQNIAATYRVNVNELLNVNPQIVTEAVILPGVVLSIPRQDDQYPCSVTPPDTTWPTPLPIPTPQPEPEPEPEPAPWPTVPDMGGNSMEDQVVDLVNSERERRGLQPLSVNQTLTNIARMKSSDMANNNYFDHNSPTYGTPFEMLRNFGVSYSSAGENIAKGQTTAQVVMNTWMNSSGHAANILNANYTQIGVGYAYNNGMPIWTQLFLRP